MGTEQCQDQKGWYLTVSSHQTLTNHPGIMSVHALQLGNHLAGRIVWSNCVPGIKSLQLDGSWTRWHIRELVTRLKLGILTPLLPSCCGLWAWLRSFCFVWSLVAHFTPTKLALMWLSVTINYSKSWVCVPSWLLQSAPVSSEAPKSFHLSKVLQFSCLPQSIYQGLSFNRGILAPAGSLLCKIKMAFTSSSAYIPVLHV